MTFRYDVNERMHCEFLDVESGQKYEATLNPKRGAPAADDASIIDFTVE